MRRQFPALYTLLAMLLLCTACAPFGPERLQKGDMEPQVLQVMGKPTAIHVLPASSMPAVRRLEYARGPWGQVTFMVDLDSAAHVVRIEQVLTTANFERIQIGQWTKEEVRRTFGPPAETGRVHNGNETWSYRYQDIWNLMYHVYFDETGRVTRAHQGPDSWMECRLSIMC